MEENKNKSIYVAYVGVGEAVEDDVTEIMKAAYESISPIFNVQEGEVIFIPIRSYESRLECINPKYITDDELIRKNRLLLDELHEHLDAHVKKLVKDVKPDEENGR